MQFNVQLKFPEELPVINPHAAELNTLARLLVIIWKPCFPWNTSHFNFLQDFLAQNQVQTPTKASMFNRKSAARLLHLSWEQVHLAALARLQDIAGNCELRNVTTRSLLNDLPGSLRTGERRQRPGHGNAINRSAPKGFSAYSDLIEFVCVLIPLEGNLSDTMSTWILPNERTSPIKSHPRDPGFWLIRAKWG